MAGRRFHQDLQSFIPRHAARSLRRARRPRHLLVENTFHGVRLRDMLLRGTLLRMLALSVLLLALHEISRAQSDEPSPRRTHVPASLHPVIGEVRFEGNREVDDALLAARVRTRPTRDNLATYVFGTLITVPPLDRLYTPEHRARVRSMVGRMSPSISYLNLAVLAADTLALRSFYADLGYHDAHVRALVERDGPRSRAVVRFIIQEGRRSPVRGVHVAGLEGMPEEVRQRVLAEVRPLIGRGYDKGALNVAQSRAVRSLREIGYAFAISPSATVIRLPETDMREREDSLIVWLIPGRRYRFGATIYVSDTTAAGPQVDSGLVLRRLGYRVGEWYSAAKVERAAAGIYELGAFERVRIDTVATADPSLHDASGDTLPMRVETRLAPFLTIEPTMELQYQERAGERHYLFGGSLGASMLNLARQADRLGIAGRVLADLNAGGRLLWGVSGSYEIPSTGSLRPVGSDELGALVSAGYDEAVEDLIEGASSGRDVLLLARTASLVLPQLTWRLPEHVYFDRLMLRPVVQWTSYAGVGRYLETIARQRMPDLPSGACAPDETAAAIVRALADGIYRVQVLQGDAPELASEVDRDGAFDRLKYTLRLGARLSADHRNDRVNPSDGDLAYLDLEAGINGALGGGFMKLDLDYHRHIPSGDASSWALRGRLGWIYELGSTPLTPVASRFSAGGPNSLRAWEPRSMLVTTAPESAASGAAGICAAPAIASILDESRRLLGALGVVELMAEYRWSPFTLPASTFINRQLNNVGMTFFMDVGNAYLRDYRQDSALVSSLGGALETVAANLAWGAGMELGYETILGPIRVGVGYPIYNPASIAPAGSEGFAWNRPLSMDDAVVHLGIGHAF